MISDKQDYYHPMSNPSMLRHPTDVAYETFYNPFAEMFQTRVSENFNGLLVDIDDRGPYLDIASQGAALDKYTDTVATLAGEVGAEVIKAPSRRTTFTELRNGGHLLLNEYERSLPDVDAFIAKMERNARVGMFEAFVCMDAIAKVAREHLSQTYLNISGEFEREELIGILRRSGRMVIGLSGLPDATENAYMDGILESGDGTLYLNDPATNTVESQAPSSVLNGELHIPTRHLRVTQGHVTSDLAVEWATRPPRRPTGIPNSPQRAGCPMTRVKRMDGNWQQNVSVYEAVMLNSESDRAY
jgi:hypothetical protein